MAGFRFKNTKPFLEFKMKKLFYFLFLTMILLPAQQQSALNHTEWWFDFRDSGKNWAVFKLILYEVKYYNGTPKLIYFDEGYTRITAVQTDYNGACDIGNSLLSTDGYIWDSLPGETKTYCLRVVNDNKYCLLDIPGKGGDFLLTYQTGSSFSIPYNVRGVSFLGSGNWNEFNVYVKNSFAGGNVIINGETKNVAGTQGVKIDYAEAQTFPHYLTAVDMQSNNENGSNYKMKYSNWETIGSGIQTSSLDFQMNNISNATHQANFLHGFDLTVYRSRNQGIIEVNNTSYNSNSFVTWIKYDSPNTLKANDYFDNTNKLIYRFVNWSTGETNPTKTIYPTSNVAITANYKIYPMGWDRNITLYPGLQYGQYVKFTWNDHPNTGVSGYKIKRRMKNGGSWVEIGFVNRGQCVFEDRDVKYWAPGAPETTTFLYDVAAYYSPEQTETSEDFVFINGKLEYEAKINDDKNNMTSSINNEYENSITNYPNPFNPATVISYSIKERGLVQIKVYDILGRVVAVLVDEYKDAGRYSITFNAGNLSSGFYVYSIKTAGFSQTRKMMLSK